MVEETKGVVLYIEENQLKQYEDKVRSYGLNPKTFLADFLTAVVNMDNEEVLEFYERLKVLTLNPERTNKKLLELGEWLYKD